MMMPRFACAVVVASILTACGQAPLQHTRASAEELARDVLSALARQDEAGLRMLAINEHEFEVRVWPGLPASRPERNMPWSYVWLDLRQKSDAMLRRTLSEHGGRSYELESVLFSGESTNHDGYRVHRGTIVVVRDPAGESLHLRILGSMLEADVGWKVFSYLADR